MSDRFPGRRFSFLRLGIATVITAALALSGVIGWNYTQQNQNTADRWFGGYVDVTATPSYTFESLTGAAYQNIVLSFLVSRDGGCTPTWGGFYSPDEAADSIDLDRRIARVASSGREIVLSFGGESGVSLASTCGSVNALASAYEQAIERYDATVIDLDIEGQSLSDSESRSRRVAAVKQLQSKYASKGETLGVWLTLPADDSGLTAEGISAVKEYIDADVVLSGVNLMVMNFGIASHASSQSSLAIDALNAGHSQVRNLFWLSGQFFSNEQVWRRLGATPMIGQNDLKDEQFTLEDARQLRGFADKVELGRISFWSLNRDQSCDANYPNESVVATFCSGIGQSSGQFAQIFSDGLTGGAAASAEEVGDESPEFTEIVEDNPETSPYPIWDATRAYSAATKVVWKGNVYISQWWTRGDQPDLPSDAEGAAWRLIGPVLPGDRPIVQPTLPEGYYAAWDPSVVYHRGDRVMHEGVAYEVKWWSQGDSPDAGTGDPGSSPWQALSPDEITAILEKDKKRE